MTETAVARIERNDAYVVGVDDAISPQKLTEQVALIQNVMRSVMKDKEHYGLIPGCGDKPTLLKPGAEKLCFTFRMDPEFEITDIDMGKGHREYRIKCTLYSISGGNRIGSGVGSASTMESKWRFRTGPVEFTGKPVPKEYWDNTKTDYKKALEAIGGKGFSAKKNPDTGKWEIAVQGEKVEHDNPADVYNTVLKMAKKRAMVDAVLTCTAASDIFTQDVEELVENGVVTVAATVVSPPAEKPQSEKPAEPPPPPAPAGVVNADTAPAPPAGLNDLPDDTVSPILQDMMQTAQDMGAYQKDAEALYAWTKYTKDGKEHGFRDVAKLKKWQMLKAIEKAMKEGYLIADRFLPREPGQDDDESVFG